MRRPRNTSLRVLPDLNPVEWWRPHDPAERQVLLLEEKLRRCAVLRHAEDDPKYRDALYTTSRGNIKFFFNNFAWTFDPRDMEHYPFTLWPIQGEYLDFLQASLDRQTDWMCEKSRDMGITYLNAGFASHHWLFVKGFHTGFCANKVDLVDALGNPSTILEKCRMIIDRLPWWMKPMGYNRTEHALYLRFVNPVNGNTIIGEGGPNAGRGGRTSIYFLDEAAHFDNPGAVNLATSGTSRCRGWVSSANGVGNFFYEQRESGAWPILPVHWRDHPWKDDAWAKAEKKRIGAVAFAQEHDIDYAASLSGMVIEKPWVDAALWLFSRLRHPDHGDRVAGLDVGAGKDLSVFQPRIGELVPRAHSRSDGDTTDTANWALALCGEHRIKKLIYDPVGVGEGVKSTFKRGWHERNGLIIHGCNWGLPAGTSRKWQDGRSSAERFANIKAELWWIMRERFRASYELYLFLTDQEGGVEHPQSDCILLEPSPELQRQLVSVKYSTTATGSKIAIESKKELQRRNVKSPDFADALAYSFRTPPTVSLSEGLIIGASRGATDMGF